MDRARDRASAAVSFFLFVLSISVDAAGPAPGTPLHSLAGSPHLVLPLVLSRANSTRRSPGSRRFLSRQFSANARMRLYDDLLTNGYYTTRLFIGSPPQKFALIVDSGSTVTYVPCSTCEQCGNHQDPRFQPDLSSTYEPVKCNVACTCDQDQKQCTYERQYAEMSSSTGVLGEDLISFGTESELKPQRATFGCENSETGDLFSQHADGIIGLGRGPLSLMDQLVEKGVIGDSFSLCYGGMDIGGGTMVLGEITPPTDMVFSRSDPVRSAYYNIELKGIYVDGRPLQIDSRVFDGRHGTVLDSGTTYAYLPEEAFIAFQDAILSKLQSLKQIPGPDPNYKDICFSGAGSDVSQLSNIFPKVDMVFGNGEKLTLSPENYLFRHSKVSGGYCLGVFQNGRDQTTLLGGIVVRNTLVTYDRQNERIGFWKTNCSELWERLHVGGAPSPAPSQSTNSTIFDSPAPSPSVLPDQFKIGLIAFEMSLNITYADLLPHTMELAVLIANELGIDTNQVHLVNIMSEGNTTRLRWEIFPNGSSNYFSSSAATNIISRLTEHQVHLPENFGSYQLVGWNVEPPSRRTWWGKHAVAVIAGISLVILLSFSTFFVWHFWRQRKGFNAYRSVDAPVPEQELQPL
ncbi:aspartic proteinase nepenthesin-2-like [Zingiber officinale]|uniref:aspartic proteinase nepenthesin-2-like n=1 Tax=Zingiber officinale TaxID=94328 RepID=UPI001C4D9FDB|nr:aspartic proteinase nepenthesin-2-like [Zingiber officinale]